jgi:tRNA dimethylallyltransferase
MAHLQPFIVVLGPTASGKTRLAVRLAHHLGGEIISADSRQVYKDMDIGTGKDLNEYLFEEQPVAYHLIDVVEAGEHYHLYRYQQGVAQAIADCQGRERAVVLCGGSGLYLEAILKGHQFTAIPVDEALRQQLSDYSDQALRQLFESTPSVYASVADLSTRKRLIRAIEISRYLDQHQDVPSAASVALPPPIALGIHLPTELRRERISNRLHDRLHSGLIEEVESLLRRGIEPTQLIFYGLEYKFVTEYLIGQLPYDTMVERLRVAIHQFAKRQMTFFRKMERDGLPIHWLDGRKSSEALTEDALKVIKENLATV